MSELLDGIPELEFTDNPPITENPELLLPEKDPNEVVFTPEDIPTWFKTPEEIEQFLSQMVFFNQNLQMTQAGQDMDPFKVPPLVFLQMQKEFWVVQRMLTIQLYYTKPEKGREGFQQVLTRNKPYYPGQLEEVLMITRNGSQFSKADFAMYKQVYDKLYQQYLDNREKIKSN